MDRITAGTRRIRHNRWGIGYVMLAVLSSSTGSAFGQATNQITAIDPDSGPQGTTGLLVTFTLDTDAPPAPPADVVPDSVTIGELVGTSVMHTSQYVVTAVFDIPFDEPPGPKDANITFTTLNGELIFSMVDGFTVTAGPDTPPTITQHPQSQTAPPGSWVTFAVVAYGTEPLSYQWQKDGGDITGATDTFYAINPVSESDAGGYRCVVTNDFGTATSDEAVLTVAELPTGGYRIVDTGQDVCYDDAVEIACPGEGDPFYGQDAQYDGNAPSYALSGDGLTVHDNVTGLTWTQDADLDGDGDIDVDDKRTYYEAQTYPDTLNAQNFGGYDDWRVPTIKELYSLMDFRGTDPMSDDPNGLIPFIDTTYFAFAYGDLAAGERIIDSQWVTSTLYVADNNMMFGVNFADGRIKGYGLTGGPGGDKTFYVRLCRGNTDYGINNFTDNGDGTITDLATGLMWSQDDRGDGINTGPRSGMIWVDALAWVQEKNDENYLGYNDWRLPNAKEMQSIVDYSRAPDATGSAAIDPIFNTTQITNEASQVDYPWFWTGTTHARQDGNGSAGAYICFGRALGYMGGWVDIHGAGCQRSDRKDGDFTGYTYVYDGYYFADAPQGDATRMYNYVRLVRDVLAIEGDLDGDGCVDQSDLGILLADWNCTADCVADLDGDDDTDQADLGILLAHWGEGCS